MESSILRDINPSLQKFFQILVDRIRQNYGEHIASIVLFGSATTDEWIKGKSDVDFIIVIKEYRKKKEIEKFVSRLMMEIDSSLGLGLKETCSGFKHYDSAFVNLMRRIEGFLMFGKPFYVLSLSQIDFERNRINDYRIRLVTSIFDSTSIFVARIKQTGRTIYGRDLISKLAIKRSKIEKVKTAIAPIWLLVASAISVFPERSLSIGYSTKATVWACEDALFAIDENLSSARQEIHKILQIYEGCSLNFNHLKKTLKYKYSTSYNDVSIGSAMMYLIGSVRFIISLYICTVVKCYFP